MRAVVWRVFANIILGGMRSSSLLTCRGGRPPDRDVTRRPCPVRHTVQIVRSNQCMFTSHVDTRLELLYLAHCQEPP